ncbi:M15 family metallopeptidase [Bacillus cereus]|uniref:D-alanyl-D-alanine carboxypeptidase n=1 Tax=Bacillus cereus TaxID=1396 RepID=A0A164KFY4_BACCE|nr:M15 family metallopeptidase [Bacillus cereus]KZD50199.1 D-alanyl-D-alanine carboxypeptidase [Bacillus cereus]
MKRSTKLLGTILATSVIAFGVFSYNTDTQQEKPVFPKQSEMGKKDSDGLILVTDQDSPLVIVNKERKLSSSYVPKNLRIPNVKFPYTEKVEKKYLQDVAATALEEMFEAAKEDNIHLFGVSGYRSYQRQTQIYKNNVKTLGKKEADAVSAVPGTSEHQTGLSIDISSQSANFELEQKFGETPEGKWVAEHAHEYGFIIRYPADKTKITGYTYEPWHIRYVGKEHAAYIYQNGSTLEEATR